MLLAQPEIRRAVKAGKIKFDPPIEDSQWGEASIDLRLGAQFTKLRENLGLKLSLARGLETLPQVWDTTVLDEKDAFGKVNCYCLEPGEFILAMTHEIVTIPTNLIGFVEGRSTYARFGLSMHQTAPWIQPGWVGPIALEIKNHGSIKIDLTPLLDRPCQLSFFKMTSAIPDEIAYGAKPRDSFKHQRHPFRAEGEAGTTAKLTKPNTRRAILARPRSKK